MWPLFPSRSFFCLSASLSLIRPAVESGSLGKHSRVWLALRLNEAEIGASGGGGCKLGGRALPTIFPIQYTLQSGALAGCHQLSPLRLLWHPPPFTSPFSILLFFLVLLSTFPPYFLSIPTLLPIVIICALPAAESTQLLLVMTQSRRLLSGIITEIFPFSLFLSVSVEAIETIIRGLQ